VLALDLDLVETAFEREPHDFGALRLGRAVGDQRQLDAQLLQPIEGLVRVGEHRQFLVVQGVIGGGQCVTDRLWRHRALAAFYQRLFTRRMSRERLSIRRHVIAFEQIRRF
jgi:hypothetical protein